MMFLSDSIMRRQAGLAMLFIGAGLILLSAVLTGIHFWRLSDARNSYEASAAVCQTRMRDMGAEISRNDGNQIEARWKSLDGGVWILGKMSASALSCPGWDLVAGCVGQACPTPGATITLRRR